MIQDNCGWNRQQFPLSLVAWSRTSRKPHRNRRTWAVLRSNNASRTTTITSDGVLTSYAFYIEPPVLLMLDSSLIKKFCKTFISSFVIIIFFQFFFNFDNRWVVQGKNLLPVKRIETVCVFFAEKMKQFLHFVEKKLSTFNFLSKKKLKHFSQLVEKSETLFASCQKKWNVVKHFQHFIREMNLFSLFIEKNETVFASCQKNQ